MKPLTRRAAVRLVAFLLVAGLLAVMEINTLTGPHTGTTDTWKAVFAGSDGVSGLREGNSVRVAGVPVGKVESIRLVDATHAEVSFTANRNQRLTTRTWAVVRYANLLGQRYLALTQQGDRPGDPLARGATIPQQRTAPALSLTILFNGFRPLFNAISPEQVNQLSQDVVELLQGQTGRIEDLVSRTASLTTDLAGRSDVFNRVIDSLSTLLKTAARNDNRLAQGLVTLQRLTARVDADGRGILNSLASVDRLLGSVADLARDTQRHSLPADVRAAASLTGELARNTTTVTRFLTGFSQAFATFARLTQYGNWVNIYPCSLRISTFGKVNVTGKQIVGGLVDFLGGTTAGGILGPVGDLVDDLLGGVGLDQVALPVPLTLPNGRVGGSSAQTAVCR